MCSWGAFFQRPLAAQEGPYQIWKYAWQKIASVRKVFYLRAGALDVIFSYGFGHILSKIFRSLGCLEWRSLRSIRLKFFIEHVFEKLVYSGNYYWLFLYKLLSKIHCKLVYFPFVIYIGNSIVIGEDTLISQNRARDFFSSELISSIFTPNTPKT